MGGNSVFFQRYLEEQPRERTRAIMREERRYTQSRRFSEGPAERDYGESFLGFSEHAAMDS